MLHDLAMTQMALKISQGHQIASQETICDIEIDPLTETAFIVGEVKWQFDIFPLNLEPSN